MIAPEIIFHFLHPDSSTLETCSTVLSTITWAPTSPRVPRFDEEVFYTPGSTTNSTDDAFSLCMGSRSPVLPASLARAPNRFSLNWTSRHHSVPNISIAHYLSLLRFITISFSEVTLQTRRHLFEWAPSPPRCDSPFNSISSSLVLRCHGEFRAVV